MHACVDRQPGQRRAASGRDRCCETSDSTDPPADPTARGVAHDQRDLQAGIVERAFGARHRDPVVGGEDDERFPSMPRSRNPASSRPTAVSSARTAPCNSATSARAAVVSTQVRRDRRRRARRRARDRRPESPCTRLVAQLGAGAVRLVVADLEVERALATGRTERARPARRRSTPRRERRQHLVHPAARGDLLAVSAARLVVDAEQRASCSPRRAGTWPRWRSSACISQAKLAWVRPSTPFACG